MTRLNFLFLMVFVFSLLGSSKMKFMEDLAKGRLTILSEEQKKILTYCFGGQLKPGIDSKYTQSCYIHPLFSLDGLELTEDSPKDHFHHHGLFWTWPVVRTRGQDTGTWEPRIPSLRQHFVRWLKRKATDRTFVLGVENAWKLDEKEVVAKEKVYVRVHALEKQGRLIDLELEVEAVGGPLELQGTPEENKGYGGLTFRGSPMFTGATMTTEKGILAEDAVHTPFLWADLSTRELGVAIFVSPDHPGFPARWLIRNSYAGLINVSWPGLKPVTLKPGEPVILRYRIFIHRGDARTADVASAYERYLKERRVEDNPLSHP